MLVHSPYLYYPCRWKLYRFFRTCHTAKCFAFSQTYLSVQNYIQYNPLEYRYVFIPSGIPFSFHNMPFRIHSPLQLHTALLAYLQLPSLHEKFPSRAAQLIMADSYLESHGIACLVKLLHYSGTRLNPRALRDYREPILNNQRSIPYGGYISSSSAYICKMLLWKGWHVFWSCPKSRITRNLIHQSGW